MLREVGLNLIYLASCVVCEEALGKHDKDILKTFGGPTLIIVISFCALVRLLMRFPRGVCSSRGRGGAGGLQVSTLSLYTPVCRV